MICSTRSAKVKFRGRPAVRQENCQGLLSAAGVIRQAQVERQQPVSRSRTRRTCKGQLMAGPCHRAHHTEGRVGAALPTFMQAYPNAPDGSVPSVLDLSPTEGSRCSRASQSHGFHAVSLLLTVSKAAEAL